MKVLSLLFLFGLSVTHAQDSTRGIGVYPGDPKEYMGPKLTVDSGAYRNLALHRPAYQSSAYDYNLTAQLITDGIKETALPQWIATSTSDSGELIKTERELFLDGNVTSSVTVKGDHPWVEFDMNGGGEAPELDRIDLYLRKIYGPPPTGSWAYAVMGSDDHVTWTELGTASGATWPNMNEPGPSFKQTIPFTTPSRSRYYRLQLSADSVHSWGVAELVLFDREQEVRIAGPEHF